MQKRKKIITAKAIYPFKSKLEKGIYETIKHQFPNDEKININEKGLLKSNKRLELDLYFPNYKIGIEIQGPIHTQNENIILKDYKKKKLFLLEKDIKIIYVYTNTYENKKYSIKKCISIIKNEWEKKKKL